MIFMTEKAYAMVRREVLFMAKTDMPVSISAQFKICFRKFKRVIGMWMSS